jgi:hypothetical protein
MSNAATSADEIAEDNGEDKSIDDDDDDGVVQESICNKATKQSFVEMLTRATTGQDFLPLIDLLPNSSQCYGHSITMNAIMKIKETKVPAKKKKVPEMYNMVKQLSPTHGPWHEVVQLLHNCDEAFNDSAAALRLVGMPAYHTACL